MPTSEIDPQRRRFLTAAAATLALAACRRASPRDAPKEGDVPRVSPPESSTRMPRRKLGKTGVEVSAIGLGGYHIAVPKEENESIRIVRSAIDRGITFLDNSWDYHDGESEVRMGKALRDGYRDKVFLMTKLDGRTKAAVNKQLDESLKRLQTDHVDLLQIHEVIRLDDPKRCFEEGCIEALLDAKKAGKLRFIGFTGHKDPDIHLAMLDMADKHHFEFDTVQMPLNVLDAHYRSFEKKVLPRLVSKNIGVLGMKALADGEILKSKAASAVECLQYALSLPTSVVITGCDSMGILDQAIDVAINFKPLAPEQKEALLARTAPAAKDGTYEKFKTSDKHDSTSRHPEWLG